MRRRSFFLFFLLPFLGIAFLFFLLFSYNRVSLNRNIQALVQEQLMATASILKVGIAQDLALGRSPGEALEAHGGEESIYFMALLDRHRAILAWRSQFEGYLPYSPDLDHPGAPWVIPSPAGPILNLVMDIPSEPGGVHQLYIGYSLQGLEKMSSRSERQIWFFLAILMIAAGVVARGAFLMQSHFLAKAKEAEDALAEQKRMREISAFTSAMAHEIKNPLNSLALLFNLLNRKSGVCLQEEIALGRGEVGKIVGVVDRFSDALKPLTAHKEKVPLKEAVLTVLDSLESSLPGSRARIRIEVPPGLSANADPRLLFLILSNLVKNALEASSAETVRISVERKADDSIILKVMDKGPGIPEDLRQRLFEPFSSSGKSEGMGVGLYLVKKAVEAHGGKVEIPDRTGAGTTFIIRLPGG